MHEKAPQQCQSGVLDSGVPVWLYAGKFKHSATVANVYPAAFNVVTAC
jgi:hypothetical protein